MIGPVSEPNLVFWLSKGYGRFFGITPGGDIAKRREVRQILTIAIPLVLLLLPFRNKDKVHDCVPGVVNTNEE